MLSIKKKENNLFRLRDDEEELFDIDIVVESKKKIRLENNLVFDEEVVADKLRDYLIRSRDRVSSEIVSSGASGERYKQTIKVNLPSLEGFRVYLNITNSLWKRWLEDHIEFKNLIGYLEDVRSIKLQANSLSGDYSPVLSKLFLGKLGYTDNDFTNNIMVGENAVIMIPEKVPLDPQKN